MLIHCFTRILFTFFPQNFTINTWNDLVTNKLAQRNVLQIELDFSISDISFTFYECYLLANYFATVNTEQKKNTSNPFSIVLDKIVLCFVTRSLSATTQKNRLDRAGEKGVKAWNGPKIHQFAENFALNAIFFRNKPVLFYLHNFLSRESERKLIFENRINDFMKITSELN